MSRPDVTEFVQAVVPEDMHLKRVQSLAAATTGLLEAGQLGISAIGRGLALASGGQGRHATKQVDRLLSNRSLDVWEVFGRWIPFVVAERDELWVALDWTEFDDVEHSTLVASLITTHGRATPLIWKSLTAAEANGHRSEWEEAVLRRLKESLPSTAKRVVVIADRGFGDVARWDSITKLGFDFLIRMRGDFRVISEKGEQRSAIDWVSSTGTLRTLTNVLVTQQQFSVATFVAVRDPAMKEAWCLASSLTDVKGVELKKAYGRRFTIEESFRDVKDLRFGMGLKQTRIKRTDRRDRLLLLSAFAVALLTLLGAAGEVAGIDRYYKTNTSKRRQQSLFNQGCDYYWFLPTMRDAWAEPLMRNFSRLIEAQPVFRDVLGVI